MWYLKKQKNPANYVLENHYCSRRPQWNSHNFLLWYHMKYVNFDVGHDWGHIFLFVKLWENVSVSVFIIFYESYYWKHMMFIFIGHCGIKFIYNYIETAFDDNSYFSFIQYPWFSMLCQRFKIIQFQNCWIRMQSLEAVFSVRLSETHDTRIWYIMTHPTEFKGYS